MEEASLMRLVMMLVLSAHAFVLAQENVKTLPHPLTASITRNYVRPSGEQGIVRFRVESTVLKSDSLGGIYRYLFGSSSTVPIKFMLLRHLNNDRSVVLNDLFYDPARPKPPKKGQGATFFELKPNETREWHMNGMAEYRAVAVQVVFLDRDNIDFARGQAHIYLPFPPQIVQ